MIFELIRDLIIPVEGGQVLRLVAQDVHAAQHVRVVLGRGRERERGLGHGPLPQRLVFDEFAQGHIRGRVASCIKMGNESYGVWIIEPKM